MYIYAEKIFFQGKMVGPAYLEINNGKFGKIKKEVCEDDYIIDYKDFYVLPGLVDTHIHGYNGLDIMDDTYTNIVLLSKKLLEVGVTTFIPTLMSTSKDKMENVIHDIYKAKRDIKGAKVPGVFLEGPFFSEKYKGAQNSEYFNHPYTSYFENLTKDEIGLIKKIAIAPELKYTEAFIDYCLDNNIVVGLGHSDANFIEANKAFAQGAKIGIHTFNGMRKFNSKDPGLLEAIMINDNVYAELICDGYHIHHNVLKMFKKIKPKDKIVLVSDNTKLAGLPDGTYDIEGISVQISGGICRTSDGNLAGSTTTLLKSLKNIVEWKIFSLEEVIPLVTSIPAKSINIDNFYGTITENRSADFIIVDKQLNLENVFINGELAYEKK